MPRIQLIDWFGATYSISSSDPDLIGRWLAEQVAKFVNVNAMLGHIRLTVWPEYSYDNTGKHEPEPDWPIGKQGNYADYILTREKLTQLAQFLEGKKMSEARWCDYGDHAYKGGRPGTIMLGQTVETHTSRYDQQVEQKVQEMCPERAAQLALVKAYTAPEAHAEHQLKILERIEKKLTKSIE